MADHKSKADYRGFQRASDTWKPSWWKSPPQSKKWFCQWIQISKRRRPCFRRINNSWYAYTLKTVNNFNASLPFGLYDIFNYLICSPELITGSTLRFKRALATAYSSVDLPVWRSSVRRVLAKANFLASLFVCFSFARCLPFTIESRHLGMVYIFIPKTKQWYKRMTELTYPFFTSYSRYGIRIQFCWTISTDKM